MVTNSHENRLSRPGGGCRVPAPIRSQATYAGPNEAAEEWIVTSDVPAHAAIAFRELALTASRD
jgi:hypothetical protein